MHQVHRRLQIFLQFLYYAAVHTSYAHFAIVVCGECGFVASLWEGYRTKVAHYAVVFDSLKFPQMSMTVNEYVVCESRTVLLVVYMSVSDEHASAAIYNQGIVSHDWKFEQHLVNLSVAVATHGNDTVLSLIEQLNDTLRVNAFRNAVARSVVEYVAKNEQHVILLAVVEVEHTLKRGQTSVYVGYK